MIESCKPALSEMQQKLLGLNGGVVNRQRSVLACGQKSEYKNKARLIGDGLFAYEYSLETGHKSEYASVVFSLEIPCTFNIQTKVGFQDQTDMSRYRVVHFMLDR